MTSGMLRHKTTQSPQLPQRAVASIPKAMERIVILAGFVTGQLALRDQQAFRRRVVLLLEPDTLIAHS